MTLLTVAEFRDFEPTAGIEDESIQLLLDAAEAEIDASAGPAGAVTEYLKGGGRLGVLQRAASAITSITEVDRSGTSTVLAADDYLLHPAGFVVERLSSGTNPATYWSSSHRLAVVYTAKDDDAIRRIVQLDLARLMLNFTPGMTSEQVGAWSRSLSSNATWNQAAEREAILSRLDTGSPMLVIG